MRTRSEPAEEREWARAWSGGAVDVVAGWTAQESAWQRRDLSEPRDWAGVSAFRILR